MIKERFTVPPFAFQASEGRQGSGLNKRLKYKNPAS
jgi:hypothetical protein